MNVTFKKMGARRYGVYVERDRAPALWIWSAPGYDDYLPHDILHFVAEAEFGLDGAVFGDLAAGGNAHIFIPVDKTLAAKMWRKRRMHRNRLPDGRRSELLAGVLEAAWKARRGSRASGRLAREADGGASGRGEGGGAPARARRPRPALACASARRIDDPGVAAARAPPAPRYASRSRQARSPSRQCGRRGASGRSLRSTE